MVNLLTDPRRNFGTNKAGRTPTTLLTSIATCSVCGGKITAGSLQGRPIYKCRSNSCLNVPRAVIDEWVTAYILDMVLKDSYLDSIGATGDEELDAARREVMDMKQRLNSLATTFALGSITSAQMVTASDVLRERLTEAERRIVDASSMGPLRALIGVADVETEWLTLPLHQQRSIVSGLLSEVTLSPWSKSRKPGRRYDPAVHVGIIEKQAAAAA